jgi:hypothetical protein
VPLASLVHENHTYKTVLSLYSRAVVSGRGDGILATASLAPESRIQVEHREPNLVGAQRYRRFKGQRLSNHDARNEAKTAGIDSAELARRTGPCCDCGADNLAKKTPVRGHKGKGNKRKYYWACFKRRTSGRCKFFLSDADWEAQLRLDGGDASLPVGPRKKQKTMEGEDVSRQGQSKRKVCTTYSEQCVSAL